MIGSEEVQFRFDFDEECMLTGENLPYYNIRIETDKHYIMVGENGLNLLIDISKGRISEGEFGEFILDMGLSTCYLCESERECVILKKDYGPPYESSVCYKCLDDIRMEYDDFMESVVSYSNSNIFKVVDYYYGDKRILDVVSGSSCQSEFFFVFISASVSGFYTDARNIRELYRGLCNPEESEFVREINKVNEDHRICHNCRNRIENGILISSCFLCFKCCDWISYKLDNYLDENEELIVSKTL
jgi:hypothetical protein